MRSDAMMNLPVCPVCGWADVVELLDLGEIPIFCNVQLESRETALEAATAPFRLVGCPHCGHSFNAAFDARRVEYAPSYDNSQHFSATFRAYADSLANRLIDTYGVKGLTVVDVGCGKGDLLKLLCETGGNRGFGFDVSYDGDTEPADAPGVSFRTEFFDARQAAEIQPDLVCCRHVLEHVADPVGFLRELARALSAKPGSVLYLEVPNGELQLQGHLLWDYIYEHYSYFSPTSLRRALEAAGLEVVRLESGFGNQFLCADVRLRHSSGPAAEVQAGAGLRRSMLDAVAGFAGLVDAWQNWASGLPDHDEATVLWGAGSKGVTFVNLLNLRAPRPVNWIVDQNPSKHGRYVGRTGQKVVAPEELVGKALQTVVVMNGIYKEEIKAWLDAQGVAARVIDAMSRPDNS